MRLLSVAFVAMSSCAAPSVNSPPDAAEPSPEPGVVRTSAGPVRGALEGSTFVYRGIPYAAAPVGELRWRPPQAVAPWSEVRDAKRFGPDCPQRARDGGVVGDEDCLTLNVWSPASGDGGPSPVLVFIHGGAHIMGASSRPLYEGRALSEHGGAVVVSMNYRLGVLGFLASPALGAENAHGASGNYGYLDQTAALRWVHDNIAAFGGDPSRVLLFGQSAGAYGVCMQLASPLAQGLFSRAMMLSGACTAQPKALAEQRGQNVVRQLSCGGAPDVAACLRSRSATDVAALPVNDGQATSAAAGPTVDGWFLEDFPYSVLGRPGVDTVPVVVSTTRDEYTTQLGLYGGSRPVTSAADFELLVGQLFGTRAPDVLARYPVADYASPNEALIALLSDRNFICPSRAAARQLSRSAHPVWRAVYAHSFAQGPGRALRAGHGLDLYFGFRNLGLLGYTPPSDEVALADTISDAWLSFAATGNPGPAWPTYDPALDNYVTLDTPLTTGAGTRTPYCDFWSF